MLARVFVTLRFRPELLWVSSPLGWPMVEQIRTGRVCYDCLDNFAAFYPDRRGVLLGRQEARLLKRADVVFATERQLAERCAARNRNVHLVPNAVHPRFLEPTQAPCPTSLTGLPRPVVGYVGALDLWIDFRLLRYLAEARPGWSFVLIGPGRQERNLAGIPNIHCLGPRAHADLPAFLDHFDACLIPFKDSELTRTVNPVKLYEYLARGKPVVATSTPALEPFSHVCALASSRREFLDALQTAVEESGEHRERRTRERVRVASGNTWRHRTDQARKILGNMPGQEIDRECPLSREQAP
jgi:glycosyltransferase involved in cell wall biosynthesis